MCTQTGQFMKITNAKGIFNSNVCMTKQKLPHHFNKHPQVFLHVILTCSNLTQDITLRRVKEVPWVHGLMRLV